MKETLAILIDDRERSQTIRQSLAAMPGVTSRLQRLAIGDYQVDGRLLFERKTLHDFAVSVTDGRLFRQMTRLALSPLKSVLILEGSSYCISCKAFRGWAPLGRPACWIISAAWKRF